MNKSVIEKDSGPATWGEATLAGAPLRSLAPEPLRLPLVSFVLRNWNYGQYIRSAIDSLKAQDYPHFEVIVVDNNSTDNSREIIETATSGDPRFKLFFESENFGAMGGALRGLDRTSGEFIVFVDSDDYLFPNYASMHVQAHLSLPWSVALTSNNIVTIGESGNVVAGSQSHIAGHEKREVERKKFGLRPKELIPRLKTVSDADYANLSLAATCFHPSLIGWHWAPGTANMYRRFTLELARPVGTQEEIFKLSVDGHFLRICHLLGGSAVIGLPLSAYRIHSSNFFASSPGLIGLRQGGRPASSMLAARRLAGVRVLLERAEKFHQYIPTRFWLGFDLFLATDGWPIGRRFDEAELQELFISHWARLTDVMGIRKVLKELRLRASRRSVWRIVREAHQGQLSWHLRRLLMKTEISALFREVFRRSRR